VTTGTEFNDSLSNDVTVDPETVNALGGDDIITVNRPDGTLEMRNPQVVVNGGTGSDTLIVDAAGGRISAVNGSGLDGTLSVRYGNGLYYHLSWTSIERLEITGSLFINGITTGDSVDILRFTSALQAGLIQTGGGNDEIYLSGDFQIGQDFRVDAGSGNDIIDFSGVQAMGGNLGVTDGGEGNDILRGRSGHDALSGGSGDDLLVGNVGSFEDDELTGGAGADTLIGGSEDGADGPGDWARYDRETGTGAIAVNLSGSAATLGGITLAAGTARDTFGGIDKLIGIERVRGGLANDTILGGAGANRFDGDAGNDTLIGNGGSDELIGGAGADTMIGGAENGFDTDDDTALYSFETGSGGVAVNLSGAAATVGGVLLAAGTARDSFGDIDTLRGIEIVWTGFGNDHLLGGAGVDRFNSGGGNDILDGGAGADMLAGGEGDDIYVVDDAGDTITETSGVDEIRTSLAVYTMPLGIEILSSTGDIAHDFRGNASNNVMNGGGMSDIFRLEDGGNETISGGGGNDGFVFGASFTALDKVDGGAGDNDQISLQGNYANGLIFGAQSLVNVETVLVLPGFDYQLTAIDANVAAGARLQIFGTTLGVADELVFDGSAEKDGFFVFYGGAGRDTLTGGDGNDGFYFGPGNFSGTDAIHGGPGSNDQLGLDGNYTMTLGGNFDGIETLVLYRGPDGDLNHFTLTAADTMVTAGQRLTVLGTTVITELVFDGSDELDGSFRIFGGQANDILAGGHGNDILFGAGGSDHLAGVSGNDVYLFQSVAESTAAAPDRIQDLNSGDKIDLSAIDANSATVADDAFSLIGASAFSGVAGQLRLFQSGDSWMVEGDVNGDGIADLAILVRPNPDYVPGAADFMF
jgi:Ca2+-binding RTX toxin-like protein